MTLALAFLFIAATPAPYDDDLTCGAALMAMANRKSEDPKEDEADNSAAIGQVQFFLGRLSTKDDNTNWLKAVHDKAKTLDKSFISELAMRCMIRKFRLINGPQ